jgi:hypothetical protein
MKKKRWAEPFGDGLRAKASEGKLIPLLNVQV